MTKCFVENVMVLYHKTQIELLGLQTHQIMVWMLDCWNVHNGQDFLDWIKQKYLNILVVFVLANYINALQPADAILQCPLKHAFKMEFKNWIIRTIKEQIKYGKDPNVDFKMSKLKPCICECIYNTWKELKNKETLILKGWEKTNAYKSLEQCILAYCHGGKHNFFFVYNNT
jgi:hypothetical protein